MKLNRQNYVKSEILMENLNGREIGMIMTLTEMKKKCDFGA